jgi:OPA family glycerol-3-phosphate transporter-like MFS transporter/OPA family sugar phosphate sensor protein UhpC-like MFS transporter
MSSESQSVAVSPSAIDEKSAAECEQTAQAAIFSYWQVRILIAATVGYALYYFVRKNLSVAMPLMNENLGIGKDQLGAFLTAHGVAYGISKFAYGIIGDRVNARWLMPSGLIICGVLNLLFGMSSSVLAFGVIWLLNGWFQGMGFPPCARLMTHWFPPSRLASNMAVWNISHSLGAFLILILCGYLVHYGWRLCFFVPAAIVLVGAVWLLWALRDTPESLGLPPVEGTEHADNSEPLTSTLLQFVFSNPYIWMLSFANFFVYVVRYGIVDWGPTFLKQARGFDVTSAVWMVAGFELAGTFGMLFGGWITDRIFGGRAARACLFYMVLCSGTLILFWLLPSQTWLTSTALLFALGFFIYGPQSLIGTAVANMATKRAAAAAVGLTGLFGYLSTTVSGYGVGALVQKYDWNAGFMVFVACGVLGTLVFAACWAAKSHGYETAAEI